MSLSRAEQTVHDYIARHPDEHRHWQEKVTRLAAQAVAHEPRSLSPGRLKHRRLEFGQPVAPNLVGWISQHAVPGAVTAGESAEWPPAPTDHWCYGDFATAIA